MNDLIDDENASKESTWSSEKIATILSEYEKPVKINVNLVGSEGNVPVGNTVYLYEIIDEEEYLLASSPCPLGTISLKVPKGIKYKITASVEEEGFYMPSPVTGVSIEDTTVSVRYTEIAYPKTIKDLQVLCKLGVADKVVSIGDEFITQYNGYENPWIVVDISDEEFEDGHIGQCATLEMKYCTPESIQFDAPHQQLSTEETAEEGLFYIGRNDNTYVLLTLSLGDMIPYADYQYIYKDTIKDTSLNIYRYGHNRYSLSAVRMWLNSDAEAGNWYQAPHIGCMPSAQANTINGFMAGLEKDFIDCIAKTKRTYYTNSVCDNSVIDTCYDMFFMLTGTEMYGSVNQNEGTATPYYKEVTGLMSPSNDANTGRIKYALNAKSSPQNCWCASDNRGNSNYVWNRYTTGQLFNNNAYNSNRVVPACRIG